MNVPEAAQRVAPGEGTRAQSTPTQIKRHAILTWQGVTAPRLESVRLLLPEHKMKASGRVVAAEGASTEAYSASFELTVNEEGTASRLLLRVTTADEERQISLSRSDDGVWLLDAGEGTERTEFDGAVDIDVEAAVLFNALPIRRLGLHREPGEHELPVVFVSVPDLSVRVVRQTYRTIWVSEDQAMVNYASGDFSADLVVDSDGMVLEYPGLARRL